MAIWVLGEDFRMSPAIAPWLSALSFYFLLNIFRSGVFGVSMLQRIGRVSFSMYLIHFIFARGLLPLLLKKVSMDPRLELITAYILVVLATYWVAIYTKKIIEDKGIMIGNETIRFFLERR